MQDQSLDGWRKQIDDVDLRLLELLVERMTISTHIGTYKADNKLPALDEKRWKEVLSSRNTIGTDLGLTSKLIEDVFDVIHQHSLSVQELESNK